MSVDPNTIPGLGGAPKQSSPRKQTAWPDAEAKTTTRPPLVPQIMTKAEKKRLQWDKEKGKIFCCSCYDNIHIVVIYSCPTK